MSSEEEDDDFGDLVGVDAMHIVTNSDWLQILIFNVNEWFCNLCFYGTHELSTGWRN